MTKWFEQPNIMLLNVELELKAERDNAEVRVADIASYQQVSKKKGTNRIIGLTREKRTEPYHYSSAL